MAGFNPRPRTGGDPPCPTLWTLRVRRFNPRPRTGGDALTTTTFALAASVSIHAPARGATGKRLESFPPTDQFQSTPPHGGRPSSAISLRAAEFQSTPPHGGRRWAARLRLQDCSLFQSTPPHGGRQYQVLTKARNEDGFQSTPPHGGRRRHYKSSVSLGLQAVLHRPPKIDTKTSSVVKTITSKRL